MIRFIFNKRHISVIFVALLAAGSILAQSAKTPGIIAGTYSTRSGRPLADLLLQLQQTFVSPIDYEEVPYESPSELTIRNVVTIYGPKIDRFTPITDFAATLTNADSTPYLGVQSVFAQYVNANLYGSKGYQVVQQANRIDVLPSQVLGTSGSWRRVSPVMGHTITFPDGARSVEDTLTLLTAQISKASGRKIILLTQPYRLGEQVNIGANKELPGDILAKMGEALGGTLSYQCLYDASEGAYYLNVYPVFATVTGNLHNNRAPADTQSSKVLNKFFTKDLAK